jgi:pyruvate dehydrogenase E2 component (dihydrolipoamide acetyltransferase)
MIREVLLPQVELTMESASIVKITVQEGETVKAEQCLMEVETQKAVSEIPAPFPGVIHKICVKSGDVVPEKTVLCLIADSADEIQSESAPAPEPAKPSTKPSKRATPLARKVAQDLQISLQDISGSGSGGKITRGDIQGATLHRDSVSPLRAAPAARKLAKDRGIDLREIGGTGPLGRIKVEDVLSFAGDSAAASSPWTDFSPGRLALISQMQRSVAEIPQITIMRQMDVTPFSVKEEGITFTHRLVLKLAAALRTHPLLCTITDGRRFRREPVSVAVAIDTAAGLVAPVLREIDLGDVEKISVRLNDYRKRAEARSLKNDELRDGPFALTNLGMLGVDSFTPLVFYGQTAVLAVGRTTDGAAGRKTASFSLAVDHRVVDGGEAARFLATLQREILS